MSSGKIESIISGHSINIIEFELKYSTHFGTDNHYGGSSVLNFRIMKYLYFQYNHHFLNFVIPYIYQVISLGVHNYETYIHEKNKCLKFLNTRVDLDLADYKNDIFSH